MFRLRSSLAANPPAANPAEPSERRTRSRSLLRRRRSPSTSNPLAQKQVLKLGSHGSGHDTDSTRSDSVRRSSASGERCLPSLAAVSVDSRGGSSEASSHTSYASERASVASHATEPVAQWDDGRRTGFRPDYRLGMPCRHASHMLHLPTPTQALIQVDALETHDYAFLKRSDGTHSYSILAYRSYEPDVGEECLHFVIDGDGATKMVQERYWSEFVRLVSDEGVEYEECVGERHLVGEDWSRRSDDDDDSCEEDSNDGESNANAHDCEGEEGGRANDESLSEANRELIERMRRAHCGEYDDSWVPASVAFSFGEEDDARSAASELSFDATEEEEEEEATP